MTASDKYPGFTLLELSIVLIIIALITGAIVAGRSLIHNAELQSVVSDIDRYKKAAILFKEKYNDLPGDFPRATAMWGTDPGGCPSAYNSTPKRATCNGNGDGFIVNNNQMLATGLNPMGAGTNLPETVWLWQHLANAGFIEGMYSGAYSSVLVRQLAGVSTPPSQLYKNTYDMFYVPRGASTGAFNADYKHIIVYGTATNGGIADAPLSPGLSVVDAMSIDEKVDDGFPARGMVLSYTTAQPSNANCATTAVETTAEYFTSYTGLRCALIFLTGF